MDVVTLSLIVLKLTICCHTSNAMESNNQVPTNNQLPTKRNPQHFKCTHFTPESISTSEDTSISLLSTDEKASIEHVTHTTEHSPSIHSSHDFGSTHDDISTAELDLVFFYSLSNQGDTSSVGQSTTEQVLFDEGTTRQAKTDEPTTGLATTGQPSTGHTLTKRSTINHSTLESVRTHEDVSSIAQSFTEQKLVDQGATDNNTTDPAITAKALCPNLMVYGSCATCQGTCRDPASCITNCTEPRTCVCPDPFLLQDGECVPLTKCNCFHPDGALILGGDSYLSYDCLTNCTCENRLLYCTQSNENRCSPNATCGVKNGVPQCYCNEGYIGDDKTCTLYTDCYDAYLAGHRQDGVYTILPTGWHGAQFNVYCDMTNSEGGWTRRSDRVTDFYRYWEDYKHGFGSLEQGKDFWLGNEQIHYLTNQKVYKLRVDIKTSDGSPKYAEYTFFKLGNESTQYRLRIDDGTYYGNAGNGMHSTDGVAFSTRDRDNDGTSCNCSAGHRGAWWYTNKWCELCFQFGTDCNVFPTTPGCFGYCCLSNPNGNYNAGSGESITWDFDSHCNVKAVEMKIRPFSAFQMS